MKAVKKRSLALSVCLFLLLGLLPMPALAAESGSPVYVGGVELSGSGDEPSYAVTDAGGKVTLGGSEAHYNVKWDGTALTLNGANITGGYSYIDPYGDSNCSAIYRDSDLAVVLLGKNTVTGPDSNGELINGISVTNDLTISGSGSVEITANYDAISSHSGDVTILGGKVIAVGGSSGICTYEGDLIVSGGEVTATAPGDQTDIPVDGDIAYGIFVTGNCTISGGKVTATGHAAHPESTTTYGIYVYGIDGLTVSGGELTGTATGEYGKRFGISSFDGAVITGGTVTASGAYAGIYTQSRDSGDIIMEGGTVTATTTGENGYAIYARSNVVIGDAAVTAAAAVDGGYGVYAKYGDVMIRGGKVTATGGGASFCSEEGGVTVAPQQGQQIALTAGADQDSAAAVSGSPFVAETSVSGILDGIKYVHSVSSKRALPFTDVPENQWYYDEVCYVWENGLMNGVGGNLFAPMQDTSRAMFITTVWRMAGEPESDYKLNYNDVGENLWYTEAVRWATANGIMEGYAGGFHPGDAMTREQLAAILYRYAEYKGYDVSDKGNLSQFTDQSTISGWARDYMTWAVGAGILQGSASQITPLDSAVRAQTATILMRFVENVAK